MKDQNFSIKISDLLNQTWKIDEVVFEKKFSDQIPHLTKEGISWTFVVQSLNESSLLGTLKDLTCRIDDTCDSCQDSFVRNVLVPEYIARFVIESEQTEEEKANAEESVFFIDPKNEVIDIHDMVVQAILLQEPIVKRCAACEKKLENVSDDDELPTFEAKWNINFS